LKSALLGELVVDRLGRKPAAIVIWRRQGFFDFVNPARDLAELLGDVRDVAGQRLDSGENFLRHGETSL